MPPWGSGPGCSTTPIRAGSLRFRLLFAGPLPRRAREHATTLVVHQPAQHPEDRALEGQRGDQLRVLDLAVLGLGRLLVVDQPPELLEDLRADEPCDEAAEDAERNERDLLHEPACGPPSSSSGSGSDRGGRNGSLSVGRMPASICRRRSSSAFSSAPSRMTMLVIQSHTRKAITPPSDP